MTESNGLEKLIAEKWNLASTWEGFLTYAKKNADQFGENYERADIPPEIGEAIKALDREARILVVGADWCGDVVANLPPIAKLADLSPRIQLRVLDRDRHEELMQHFLTGGGKAIPKAIIYAPDFSRRTEWGPRPAACQAIMNEHKGKLPKEDILPMIRAWYAEDRNRTLFAEILESITVGSQKT